MILAVVTEYVEVDAFPSWGDAEMDPTVTLLTASALAWTGIANAAISDSDIKKVTRVGIFQLIMFELFRFAPRLALVPLIKT